MNYVGGGFITIINYGGGATEVAPIEDFTILTQNNFDILTQSGNELVTQH